MNFINIIFRTEVVGEEGFLQNSRFKQDTQNILDFGVVYLDYITNATVQKIKY